MILLLRTQVPHCYRFIKTVDHEWCDDTLCHFRPGYSPCNALHSERIPPLPLIVRERSIAKYCPVPLITEIKTSNTNRDYLVRPHLSRRRHGKQPSRFKAFFLQNFPLHVNQTELLDLDLGTDAEVMAEALALMHWYGEIDANDDEFVLAPPWSSAPSATIHSTVLGKHATWLLDFDCCRPMSMDGKGVDRAVTAFSRNDPFYPRPSTSGFADQALWEVIREMYLQASSSIVGGDSPRTQLSQMIIGKIEGIQGKRVESRGTPGSIQVNENDT